MKEQFKGTKMILAIFFILVICATFGVCLFPIRAASESNASNEVYSQTDESSAGIISGDHNQMIRNYQDYGMTDKTEPLVMDNDNFAVLNAVFILGAVILAFLSTDKTKPPILTYIAIVIGLILFIFTTGFQKIVSVNIYTIIYSCILAVCIFEYVIVNKVKE